MGGSRLSRGDGIRRRSPREDFLDCSGTFICVDPRESVAKESLERDRYHLQVNTKRKIYKLLFHLISMANIKSLLSSLMLSGFCLAYGLGDKISQAYWGARREGKEPTAARLTSSNDTCGLKQGLYCYDIKTNGYNLEVNLYVIDYDFGNTNSLTNKRLGLLVDGEATRINIGQDNSESGKTNDGVTVDSYINGRTDNSPIMHDKAKRMANVILDEIIKRQSNNIEHLRQKYNCATNLCPVSGIRHMNRQ